MSPEDVTTWVSVLRDGGGWALSVIFMFVIAFLYRENKAKDEKLFNILERQNDALKALGDPSRLLPPSGRS